MKGAFITNRYYTDEGLEYAFNSFEKAFGDRAVLEKHSPLLCFDGDLQTGFDYDFALFWDKDYYLAAALKKKGIRIFNDPDALSVCDDKLKTYAALDGVDIPKTISAPLMYDVNAVEDLLFLDFVVGRLGFPVIVKENTGSQGRQVHKADDMAELKEIYLKLRHVPHHYQAMTGVFGQDLRVYTVGGEAVAACRRYGTDFKSNTAAGGRTEIAVLSPDIKAAAESISRQLKMDYGSVDFLISDKPVFLEANSNAYFRGIERLGVDIATKVTGFVLNEMSKSWRLF